MSCEALSYGQTQLDQISNVQKDLLANNAKQDIQAFGIKTRGGTSTQDPLYPEGHPKRIKQDSQIQEEEIVSPPKKKKKNKEADDSNDTNSISTSDAKTKTVLSLKRMVKRMIHPKFEKKK